MSATARKARRGEIRERQARIKRLRREIKRLQAWRARTVERIGRQCATGRKRARARLDAIERDELRKLKARIADMRTQVRDRCKLRRDRIELAYKTEKARQRARIKENEREAEELRKANALSFTDAELRRMRKARERAQEREHFVLADIPDELHEIYRRVRSKIPGPTRNRDGTIRTSKAERFLEWVEEHPGEVLAIRERKAERDLQQLLKEHAREEKQLYHRQLKALHKAGVSRDEAKRLIEQGLGEPLAATGTDPVPF